MEGRAVKVEFHRDSRNRELAREWLDSLDKSARSVVLAHVAKLRTGNFGKVRDLRDGLFELKIQFGPGYRLYFYEEGERLVILLMGGDKGSQNRDIQKAKQLLADIERG